MSFRRFYLRNMGMQCLGYSKINLRNHEQMYLMKSIPKQQA